MTPFFYLFPPLRSLVLGKPGKLSLTKGVCLCMGGGRGGETRLLVECDEKRDQAKGKALEFFSQNFVVSRVQET